MVTANKKSTAQSIRSLFRFIDFVIGHLWSHDSWSAQRIRHQPPAAAFGGASGGCGVSPSVSVARRQCQIPSRNTERLLRPSLGWETPNNYARFLLARSHIFPALARIFDAVGGRERRVAERRSPVRPP